MGGFGRGRKGNETDYGMSEAIGIDIVEIKRLERVSKRWGPGFLRKVYTAKELAYARSKRFPYQHLAARFAAKEAIFKALGEVETNFVGWKNVEILNDAYGKPVVHWHGEALRSKNKRGIRDIVVSLSHTENYAVASAMLIMKKRRA